MAVMRDLRELTDTQLLELVREILSSPSPLSAQDKFELRKVNDEFIRRDALRARRLCPYCHHKMSEGPRCSNCGAL